jgi:hypothetical protein
MTSKIEKIRTDFEKLDGKLWSALNVLRIISSGGF